MRQEVLDLKRKELFEYFDSKTNPFIILTTKIDVTNVVKYCKIHKNYYATIGYLICETVNEIDAFKYRKEDDKIYKYDELKINFTQMIDEDEISFFEIDKGKTYKSFIEEFKKEQEKLINDKKVTISKEQGEIWVSCAPWYEFTSLVTPYDKNVTIPQFTWGKFKEENGKFYTNLMIMVHHGFVDGNHIGILLNKLNDKINNFDKYIERMV